MSRLEQLIGAYRKHGHKMTPQRRAILEVLTAPVFHPTAETIHDAVTTRMPDISLATIYNVIRELGEMGELHDLDVGDGSRHYEIALVAHAHQVCVSCGRIDDLRGDFDAVRGAFRPAGGFRAERYSVTVFGNCPGCATA